MGVLSFESLPLGFRFRPTDAELVNHYLRLKINGRHKEVLVIQEVDVCKCEPWDLPDKSAIRTKDPEWFFFCPQDRKYPNSQRLNRATAAGYWKATGKDRKIKSGMNLIGMKKTLVFYTGRAPKGQRTNWVMHEYRPTLRELDGTNPGQESYILCRLFRKEVEKIETSNCDEFEPIVLSPTITNSSPEEVQSEPVMAEVTPDVEKSVEKGSSNNGGCVAENSNGLTPENCMPIQSHSISNDLSGENLVMGAATSEVDPQFEDDLKRESYEHILGSAGQTIFSPLHSQMHSELGSSLFCDPAINDFNNWHNGVQLQYGTNEQDADITDFLDSVFINTDEDSYEGYNLKAENEMGDLTCINTDEDSYEGYNLSVENETGDLTSWESSPEMMVQGAQSYPEIPSSLELQSNTEAQMHMETIPKASGFPASDIGRILFINHSMQRSDIPSAFNEDFEDVTNTVENSNTGQTGIRIRPRQTQNNPAFQNFASQGTAQRRIRLQMDLDAKPNYCTKKDASCSAQDYETEPSVDKDEGRAAEKHVNGGGERVSKPILRKHKLIGLLVKAARPRLHSALSPLSIFRATVVVVLFIGLAGLWRRAAAAPPSGVALGF